MSTSGGRGSPLARLADAVPDLALGVACLVALRAPGLLPPGLELRLPRLVIIEFPAIHCAGFLFLVWMARWGPGARAAYVAALTAAYSLVLGIVSLVLHDAWPLAIFWALIGNRALTMALAGAPDRERFDAATLAWAGATTLYACLMGVGLVVGGGTDRRGVLLAGFLYYASVALSELSGWGWTARWMARARSR